MKVVLKDYQENAVNDAVKAIRRAQEDWRDDKTASAVSLTATTSAGKTLIATALIERLMTGDDDAAPMHDLTVLWLTNSPSLNRQTRFKMLATSSHLTEQHLVEIDESLRGSTLPRGKVYFLNTQKLAAGATSYMASETRSVSLEQMIANTAEELGPNILLIIDEAHIGTSGNEAGRERIAYRVMQGDANGYGRFPVVLGISATPERFLTAVSKAGRASKPVSVSVDDVRASGLIKDRILAHVPEDGQYAEAKLLAEAARRWKEFDDLWRAYHEVRPGAAPVYPLLLVQVPPKTDEGQEKVRLGEILRAIKEVDSRLDGDAIAHAFGDRQPLRINGITVPHIEPEAIQAASHVRVVLFKDALTTGWDCPRAEVLVSLRSAKEAQYITQMIGRIVRTPLAQRIEDVPELNDVYVFLPLYNQETVESVRAHLSQSADDSVASEVVINPVRVALIEPVAQNQAIMQRLESIVSHSRPARRKPAVKRLADLAAMLERSATGVPIVKGAESAARAVLAGALMSVYEEHKDEIDERVRSSIETRVSIVNLGDGLGAMDVDQGVEEDSYVAHGLPSTLEVAAAFRDAAKACGTESALVALWSQLAGQDMTVPDWSDPERHLETQMLAAEIGAHAAAALAVEHAAEAKFGQWVKEHGLTLKDQHPERFADLMASTPQGGEFEVSFPSAYDAGGTATAPAGHLYQDLDGNYPLPKPLNAWESATVEAMKRFSNFVAWWRNGTGGQHSLGVRYTDTEQQARTMYPDLLGIYDDGSKVTLRLFDPHGDGHDGQSRTKWLGLAQYLRSEAGKAIDEAYGVMMDANGTLLALDLGRDDVVAALEDASRPLVDDVFKTFGMTLDH